MNKDRAIKAYEKIAEGYAELALAMADDTGAGAAVPPRSAPAPYDDDLPPLTDSDYEPNPDLVAAAGPGVAPRAAEKPQNAALGMCPVHRTAWTVKAGGISKNGNPYRPFWKCSAKDENGYCNEKPVKAWEDAHPASQAA
jgi:hypothetical protein